MDIDEKRIREFAYQIWQSEGEPEGQDIRHWEIACKLAEAESSSAPAHTEDAFPDATIGRDSDDQSVKADAGADKQSAITPLDTPKTAPPLKL